MQRPAPAWRAPLLLFLLALALRLLNMWFLSASPLFWAPTSDEFEHYSLSLALSNGDWLGRGVGLYHRPQLFAYVIAVLQSVLGQSYMVTHAFLALADSLAVVLWYFVGRLAFPRRAAFLGALLMAIYWPLIHFASTGYMESFAMAIMAAFLLAGAWALRAVARGGPRVWLACAVAGLLGAASVMSRPTALLFLPVLALLLAWRGRGGARAISVLAFAAGVAIGLAPNTARHWFLFDTWAPLGTGSELNFHMGNEIDGWGWHRSSPGIEFSVYQNLPFVEGSADPEDRASVRAFWRGRGVDYVREEPVAFTQFMLRKLAWLVNAHEIHCTQSFSHYRELSPLERWLPGFGVLVPFGILGLVFWLRGCLKDRGTARFATGLMLALWIVVYGAGVLLYLVIARHRLPMLPPLLLFSGFGLWTLWRAVTPRVQARALAVAAPVLIAAVVIVHLPVTPGYLAEHERWWTQVNIGVASRALGDTEGSAAAFSRANEILPNKPEGWRQLAIVRAGAGEFPAAAGAQAQLLRLLEEQYPEYYMIHAQELAQLTEWQLAAGDPAAALATAQRFRALIDFAPQPLVLLARAHLALGDTDAARAELARALQLAPGFPPAEELLSMIEAAPATP